MFLNEETDRVPACAPAKNGPPRDGLADSLSGLLRQAVEDAQILDVTPGYRLNMGAWHAIGAEDICNVCMAGAAVSRRLNFPRTQSIIAQLPNMKEREVIGRKLNAINNMRTGEFTHAHKHLMGTFGSVSLSSPPPVFEKARQVVRGGYIGELFRADWGSYLRAADILEAAGYQVDDAPLTDAELSLLDRCKSVGEWDAAVASIRGARGGGNPCDWYTRVMRSGLADLIFRRWEGKPQMTLPGLD